jgi:hypothetical protein
MFRKNAKTLFKIDGHTSPIGYSIISTKIASCCHRIILDITANKIALVVEFLRIYKVNVENASFKIIDGEAFFNNPLISAGLSKKNW